MLDPRSDAPSASNDVVRDWDNEHVVHPWEPMTDEPQDRMITARAEGIWIYDRDGKRYLDGPGGMWCVQIGYGRREMADAIAAQVMTMPYNSPWAFANEPAARLARKIAELSPGDLNSVFFTTGGSTAVDTALRFAQFYNNLKDRPEKKMFLARYKGYHGSTYLSATVSGRERTMFGLDTEKRLIRFLPNVNPYIRPAGMSVEAWTDQKVAEFEEAIAEVGADRIAAYISEPVMASGGVIVPPLDYHRRTREICRQHDILYISDEIVTGFGRLGHWFASEAVFGIVPDIITCAKGLTSGYLPLGAAIISDRLLEEMAEGPHRDTMFSNGYTYSGHPVSCAAALANIEIMERENILAHVRDLEPHFQGRLKDLQQRFEVVGDARGVGLVGCLEGAVDLSRTTLEGDRLEVDMEFGRLVDQACERRGLLVRPLLNMCVFSPPLIITRAEIDQMFDILADALAEVQARVLTPA